MAKRKLEDLDLGDSGPGGADQLHAQEVMAGNLLAEVLEMLESGEYDFAWGFLKDLSLTLEKTRRASAAQVEAVRNVRAGRERHERQLEGWRRHEKRTGRRYEGWEPSN